MRDNKFNNRINKIETFADTASTVEEDAKEVENKKKINDLLTVAISDNNPDKVYTAGEKFSNFAKICGKYLFLVVVLTLNFLGLSVSLNCNVNEEFGKRVLSAIFAFFFGFVYLIINYYTYRVMYQGKICKMNREKLFPFDM
jgi:hypothetical protein